jgi:hypothetical protein
VVRRAFALIAAATVLVVSGCQASQPESPAPPPVTDGDSAVVLQPVLRLSVGDCLMDQSTPIGGDLVNVPLVDCDQPHESEVFAEIVMEGTGFPGVDDVVNTAIASCMSEFADFVGVDYSSSTLDFSYYYPTPSSWAVGDRSIFCVAFDPGVLTEGTLEGSRR